MKCHICILIVLMAGCKTKNDKSLSIAQADTTKKVVSQETQSLIDSTLYTDRDSVVIVSEGDSSVYYKQTFNDIVTYFPELNSEWTSNPDIAYYNKNYNKIIDSSGEERMISFNSEAGQDEYYILYAYFLKKKTGEKKFATRRNTLIKIYRDINHIFGDIQYGGTYFGHQYKRIIGYAEYSIYWFSKREDFFTKGYDIKKQKAIYLASLRQLIKDEVSVDQNQFTPILKVKREKELLEIVDDMDKLITDYFYLKRAQEFQYSYY